MQYHAVIDTNILVSAVLKGDSVPGLIIEHTFCGTITPVLNDCILQEYHDVLRRPKFRLTDAIINDILNAICDRALWIDAPAIDIILPDPKDRVFYEVLTEARKSRDTYLITGNMKHFPTLPYIVTPRGMLTLIES